MHAFRTWLRDGRLTFRWDRLLPEQLVRLYVFANYYDFPALRRTIMTTLVLDKHGNKASRRLLTSQFADYVSQLPRASPLYQWLASVWAHHIYDYVNSNSPQAYQLENDMPEEFRELIHSIRSNGRRPSLCECCHNPCDYHEHQNEQEWKMSKHSITSVTETTTDGLQKHVTLSTTEHESPIRPLIASCSEDLEGNETTEEAPVTLVYYQNAQYSHEHKRGHRKTLRRPLSVDTTPIRKVLCIHIASTILVIRIWRRPAYICLSGIADQAMTRTLNLPNIRMKKTTLSPISEQKNMTTTLTPIPAKFTCHHFHTRRVWKRSLSKEQKEEV
jgi:hypothetical protein